MISALPFWLWPTHRQTLSILIFHRVLSVADPLRPWEITSEDFAARMALLARHCTVLPLVDAVERLQSGTLPRRACCITFDDGYADNLTVALPILQRHNLPATVFVATGYLDGGCMFNDSITEIIGRVKADMIDLTRLRLGAHPVTTREERLKTIAVLQNKFKYMPPAQRKVTITAIAEMLGCGDLPKDLMLSSAQVVELHRAGIEIGGHTVAHTILTTLDDEEACAEIVEGKRALEKLIGQPVKVFAYPNGYPERDIRLRHVEIVKRLGFQAAVTTSPGVANQHTDVFQLPRFTPWDNTLPRFAARLARNAWTLKPVKLCA